jgi:hypothetical protein
MPFRDSFIILSVWCPKNLLQVDDDLFLKILEVFWYYFIDYVFYAFILYLSFFYAWDS